MNRLAHFHDDAEHFGDTFTKRVQKLNAAIDKENAHRAEVNALAPNRQTRQVVNPDTGRAEEVKPPREELDAARVAWLEGQAESYAAEFTIREQSHAILVDMVDAQREAADAAKAAHKQAVAEHRANLDKLGLYPADAPEPRRGSVWGQILHECPTVKGAKLAADGTRGGITSCQQRIRDNEAAAASAQDQAHTYASSAAAERDRQHRAAEERGRSATHWRRKAAEREAESERREKLHHPFA